MTSSLAPCTNGLSDGSPPKSNATNGLESDVHLNDSHLKPSISNKVKQFEIDLDSNNIQLVFIPRLP